MGKGDIRTRRGKVWRGTYGVTRPRRYKVTIKPKSSARKVKNLTDLPTAVTEPAVENAEGGEEAGKKAPKKVAKKASVKKKAE